MDNKLINEVIMWTNQKQIYQDKYQNITEKDVFEYVKKIIQNELLEQIKEIDKKLSEL